MPELSRVTVLPFGSDSVIDLWSSSNSSLCGPAVTITLTWSAASAGTSPSRQYPPAQIGYDTSPPSNSIQTPLPISGRNANPTFGPAYGTQGMHQPVSVSPSTDGTFALIRIVARRPRTTMPRYFP